MNNKSITTRLATLEALPGVERVQAVFSDGTARRMNLANVIPYLMETDGPRVIRIETDNTGNRNGYLLDLVRGLLEEVDI